MDEYPPLTSIEEMAIHAGAAEFPDHMVACRRSELPVDPNEWVAYDWRCAGCVAAAEARVAVHGDILVDWHPVMKTVVEENAQSSDVTLSWLVARSRYWGVR